MEKKRYGRRMRLQLKATIKENGHTRTVFFAFPRNEKYFDRPTNIFYNVIGWFRAYFTEINEWVVLRALQKTNSVLSEKIMDFFVKKIENGELEGDINGQ